MPTIFIDESGYTGPDLVCEKTNQPVFVIASHDYPEDECKELRQKFFSKVKSTELKYWNNISGKPARQDRVLAFLKHMNPERIRFGYVHKRFALLCKIVDLVIEPFHHQNGFNLYENGQNLVFSNALQLAIQQFGSEVLYVEILSSFQNFFRDPSPQTFDACDAVLGTVTKWTDEADMQSEAPLEMLLGHLHMALWNLQKPYVDRLSGTDINIAFSVAMAVTSQWSSKYANQMVLIHDETNNMAQQKEEWDKIVSPNVPPSVVGWDRRKMTYPLGVLSTQLESSKKWAGLQIADILAGSLMDCLRAQLSNNPNIYQTDLWEFFKGWTVETNIWPEMKFSPEELGTIGPSYNDPILYIQNLIAEKPK